MQRLKGLPGATGNSAKRRKARKPKNRAWSEPDSVARPPESELYFRPEWHSPAWLHWDLRRYGNRTLRNADASKRCDCMLMTSKPRRA